MMIRSRKQYFFIVGAIVGGLLLALLATSLLSAFLVDESEIINDETTREAKRIISEVQIPIEFLQAGALQEFRLYEELSPPEQAGRANPFEPASEQGNSSSEEEETAEEDI